MQYPMLFAALLASVTPALADEPMTAAEFDAYTQGRTLYYNNNSIPYGIEEYLPNKRVRWSRLDDRQCTEGYWYQEETSICFVYDAEPLSPKCWTFWEEPDRLRGVFVANPEDPSIYEVTEADEPMTCLGPDVGV